MNRACDPLDIVWEFVFMAGLCFVAVVICSALYGGHR